MGNKSSKSASSEKTKVVSLKASTTSKVEEQKSETSSSKANQSNSKTEPSKKIQKETQSEDFPGINDTLDLSVSLKPVIGRKLEARDLKFPNYICVATIKDVKSDEVLITFDGWGAGYDYWTQLDTDDIGPVGTCEKINHILQKPHSYPSEFNWKQYLKETDSLCVPYHFFKSSNPFPKLVGMKLEARDLKNPSLICVATVKEISTAGSKVLIHFDGWSDNYDYWGLLKSNDLAPVGTCEKLGITLQAPGSKQPHTKPFSWEQYLKETGSVAVPARLFSPNALTQPTQGSVAPKSSSPSKPVLDQKFAELDAFLKSLELSSYLPLFVKEDCTFSTLSSFSEKDMEDMGIPFGPRRKITNHLKKRQDMTTFLEDIEIGSQLGSGGFGQVFHGNWQGTEVALKKLHGINKLDEFKAEADILQKLIHPHVVQYLGLYSYQDQDYIVTEYLPGGSVYDLIRKDTSISFVDLIKMCVDCAAGMLYLSSRNIIHRDLAARNLLTKKEEEKWIVKVGDFGLSKTLEGKDYYVARDEKFAKKWSAPECINYQKFSTASDVYAFGVTVWEILERGKTPWAEYSNSEAMKKVLAGERLPPPENCPGDLYEFLLGCWAEDPEKRPTFKDCLNQFQSIYYSFTQNEGRREETDKASGSSDNNLNSYLTDENISPY